MVSVVPGDRDRIERGDSGVRAVACGVRTVKNGRISINALPFAVKALSGSLEGVKVRISVLDYLASEYELRDYNDYRKVGKAVWAK